MSVLTLFRSKMSSRKSKVLSTFLVLAATRVVRGWNQTGQKFAGEPDIVKSYIMPNPRLLWALVCGTYFWIHRDLVHGFSGLSSSVSFVIATGLVLAAFAFKLSYTAEDAPELVFGFTSNVLEHLPGASLVARAQAIFIGLALATVCVLAFILTRSRISVKTTGQ